MITFYPGPSKTDPRIREYMMKAIDMAVPSMNHRSSEFVSFVRSTVEATKQNLDIPDDYVVSFVSSATECWEIIAQSFISDESLHVFNGAFGEKGWQYAQNLSPTAHRFAFEPNDALDPAALPVTESTELISFTQNETSNGTQISPATIGEIRAQYPDPLIAVDATSSMGGIALDFTQADIWYASVQKCFGLPPGMALLVCSPKAIRRAQEIHETLHYNSYLNILKNSEKFQTTHTPNNLNIFLLGEVMKNRPGIRAMDQLIRERSQRWYAFFERQDKLALLIENKAVRSDTVIAVKATPDHINLIKNNAREKDILLGRGYGQWLHQSFRIANFPAITEEEIDTLEHFLTNQITHL